MQDSSPKKKILLTRPRSSSERWAALLATHGFEAEIAPLLTIVPTLNPRPAGSYQAVMLTSASAIEALRQSRADIGDLLRLPCFCVGGVTHEAARGFGFTNISHGASDSAALAQEILAALNGKPMAILHIAGDLIDAKAQEILAKGGVDCAMWQVYRAEETADFEPAICDHFAEASYFAIPVFSPRTARVLISILEKNRMVHACHAMTAIALSQPIADVLQTLPWQRLRVAASPAEEDMLACLEDERTATENNGPVEGKNSFASLMTAASFPRRRRRQYWAWGTLVLILLASIGAITMLPLSWPAHREMLTFVSPPSPRENSDLQNVMQRLQMLEARLDTQSDMAAEPSASKNDAEIAALNDKVQTLQSALSQMQAQTQQKIAAAFAFWDLREAVRSGHAFAPELAALRTASAGDAVVEAQSTQLEPYAATGIPTRPELRQELARAEVSVPQTSVTTESQGWWARIKSILHNLVSIKPLHDPQFANLEKAVDEGDDAALQTSYAALTPEAMQALTPWKQQVDAHQKADIILRDLAAHFSTAPSPGVIP